MRIEVFDVTLTDSEFKKDFVNKDADWLQSASKHEPDLTVDGLKTSLLSRLAALFRSNKTRDVAG
jgi:hypothetical protein